MKKFKINFLDTVVTEYTCVVNAECKEDAINMIVNDPHNSSDEEPKDVDSYCADVEIINCDEL